jgi:UDPglucose 6-dehydrogenase
MKVTVLGAGYVGLVTGLCFCELGNDVTCIDVIPEKVSSLNKGICTIYEDGLQELLVKHLENGRFKATTDPSVIADSEITFIAVGTPSQANGALDLDYVKGAAVTIGAAIRQKKGYHVVVLKSTVVPGTCQKSIVPALEEASGKKVGEEVGVAVNPEFLKEGAAIKDFMNPDRIVIGGNDEKSISLVRGLYSRFVCPFVEVPLTTAEMIKVASNSFLATKISFVNEMGNICKEMGIDFRQVAEGMGHDARIGKLFLRSGCGFGGSCFPKDVKGIYHEAKRMGLDPKLLEATLEVNKRQPERLIGLLQKHMPIGGKTIAVLGLAFKPDTDDIREASSILVVDMLIKGGAKVKAYDPKGMDNFRRIQPDIEYCSSAKDCIRSSDAVIIVTEWNEFADPSLYGDKLVIDGRGITKTNNYEGICW